MSPYWATRPFDNAAITAALVPPFDLATGTGSVCQRHLPAFGNSTTASARCLNTAIIGDFLRWPYPPMDEGLSVGRPGPRPDLRTKGALTNAGPLAMNVNVNVTLTSDASIQACIDRPASTTQGLGASRTPASVEGSVARTLHIGAGRRRRRGPLVKESGTRPGSVDAGFASVPEPEPMQTRSSIQTLAYSTQGRRRGSALSGLLKPSAAGGAT
jgi:hypothetical protein